MKLISGILSICPAGWFTYFHGTPCFKIDYSEKTWFDARRTCRDYGGELVTLETYDKMYFVKGFLAHTGKLQQINKDYFLYICLQQGHI